MDHIEESEGDLKKQISSAGDKILEDVQISTQGTKEDNCYLDEKHINIVSDKTLQEISQLHHEFNPEHLSRSDENIIDRYFLYINRDEEGRPPVPLQTYRWEDLRRAQQQGGYPWTHLYKRPLGPGEEPEILVKYKIRDISFGNASPQVEKKFSNYENHENEHNIDVGTSIENHKECDKQEIPKLETLDNIDDHNIEQTHQSNNFQQDCTFPKGILKVRRKKPKNKLKFVTTPASPSLPDNSPRNSACCNPLVDKIKTMADKQLSKHHIKKIPLRSDEHIILEEQKILQLETSPEADRRKIPHFVEKQDSDDVVEILELEESPRKIRKKLGNLETENEYESILVPDEVIEIPATYKGHDKVKTTDSDKIPIDSDQVSPEEVQVDKEDHFYEDIKSVVEESIDQILEDATLNALKKSLAQQDSESLKVLNEKSILLEELGSSEEDSTKLKIELAPISSIDSASSDEVKQISTLGTIEENESTEEHTIPNTTDKKDSFCNRNGSKENHEEDILLDDFMNERRWSKMSDHVYEPIGEPSNLTSENNKLENFTQDENVKENIQPPELPASNGSNKIEDNFILNERPDSREDNSCISSGIASSRSESRTEDIHTSQVDSSALEHLPLRSENRKRSFMANAQEKSRKVHQSLRSHAGKLKTKLSKMNKPVSGSPKLKEKKKFLGRDFGKFKFDIKKPELGKNQNPTLPKFKSPDFKKIEFKRPEFPKITKPDFSKFKLPEKFSSLKLRRSRSLKEQNSSIGDISSTEPQIPESNVEKKKFDLHFATYPRILRKKKAKAQREVTSNSSDMRSTESPISTESSAILKQKVFKTGPTASSWGDKFSEVSFGDSESGKYQKYDSEPENDNINVKESAAAFNEDNKYSESPTASSQMEAIGSDELKQLAAYNEENRAIHEISKIRENEFKLRKPFVHQDSDVISEESRDAFSEKKIEHNILARSETDSEHIQDDLNNFVDGAYKVDVNEVANQDAQSTESSSAFRRKGVIEEIDDDEFFLRKKGISDENIQIREYISSAIREGLSSGQNALMQMTKEPYCSYEQSEGDGTVNYTYDVPPAKPRRIKQFSNAYCDQKSDVDVSVTDDQELPVRPSRKHKAQKISDQPEEDINFLDNHDEGFEINAYDVPRRSSYSLQISLENDENSVQPQDPPKAPKRRKKCIEQVIEDEEHVSIQTKEHASHHCPSDNTEREIVVYRTEHEYIIPLAQIDSFSAPTPPRRSRSRSRSQTSRLTEDDQISHTSDSQFSDNQLARHFRDTLDMNESDGYARIRKDAPTRPPAPIRRKKSSNSLEERRFATMPSCKAHPKTFDEASMEEEDAPKRPPRRKSTTSLEEISNIMSHNLTQYEYEEVDNDDIQNTESPRNLQSGEVMKKMKYRPLPPPPRPPREGRKSKDNIESQNNQDSFAEVVKLIEVEVSTQTDPLPEDFTCEEFEITEDMKVIEPRRTKTLEDILKEEQEAELERAKQLAENDVLSRSIQKFRESNQRSFSEKSRTSTTDNIRNSTSRPNTPSAIIVERRIPTPITSEICETLVEASLTVQPVEYDEDIQDGIESDIENEKNCCKSSPVQMHGNELEQSWSSEPPHPPPRKKFSIGDECQHTQQSCEEIHSNQTKDINKPSLKSLSNSRDKIAELEVDHFSANAIDATSITVSKLQGTSFNVQDFECKSGNLTVQNIELPKGFIDEIIERIRSTEQEFLQTLTQTLGHEEPPARPPPPEQHNLHPELVQMHPLGQALPPQRRSPEKEIQQVNVHRRRRHHRRRDSSSSDLQRDSRISRVYTHSPEKSITHLCTQLLSACGATALRTINQILNSLNISEKEYNNQNMRIIVIIFIVMTLGFLLMGMAGAKNIHHHHWDYFNPPGNGGRT